MNSQIPSRSVFDLHLIARYDSAIGTGGWALGHPRDRPLVPSRAYRPALGPTQLIIWWTAGALSGLKRWRHATFHSSPVRSHLKCVEPYLKSAIRLHDVHSNKLTCTAINYFQHAFFWVPTCTFVILGSCPFFHAAILYVFNPLCSVIYCIIIIVIIYINRLALEMDI